MSVINLSFQNLDLLSSVAKTKLDLYKPNENQFYKNIFKIVSVAAQQLTIYSL